MCRDGSRLSAGGSGGIINFEKAHPLAGTVFYDHFKDTGKVAT